MNVLIKQLEENLPEKMIIPEPLKQLYEWIESNKYFKDVNGNRYGFLYPENKLRESITNDCREGGTDINFVAQSRDSLKFWFGKANNEIYTRLCVFAQSGADGSECALWLDDNNETKIVHMGSGSGSILCCILADDAVDFLRLLAIGYDEICWNECYKDRPNADSDFIVHPNVEFQDWVKQTFKVEIPEIALDIVKYPSEIGDKNSLDPFCNWCNKQTKN